MPFKVVLCDDDELILKGLEKFIPWSDMGLELVGTGVNGKEAMELIKVYNPDIIVSDIRMPFIDGLELIKRAKEINSNVIVIFISGYDDFKYAQQAVKYGAMDYILKPIDEEILTARLKVAIEECKANEKTKSISMEHQNYMEKNLINSLINEGPDKFLKELPNNVFDESHLELYCNIMLVELDGYEQLSLKMSQSELDKMYKFLIQTCQNLVSKNIGIFSYHSKEIGLYFINDLKKKLKADRDMVINSINKQFEQFFEENSISYSCGNVYKSILKLHESFQEAKIAQKERFIHSTGLVIHYSDLKNKKNDESIKGLESVLIEIDFVKLLKQEDMNLIDVKLQQLKKILYEIGSKSYLYMTMVVANLYMSLMKELKQLGIENDGFSLDLIEEYQVISKSMSVDDVVNNLRKSFVLILEFINTNRNRYSKIINKAINYIENNYGNHLLSIEEVADNVHMSSSYFSMIFKNEKNISFTDYLIALRIDKAKEYIKKSDLKIYEISDKVGYDTAAYFSTAFKKSTGMSPSEYKNTFRK